MFCMSVVAVLFFSVLFVLLFCLACFFIFFFFFFFSVRYKSLFSLYQGLITKNTPGSVVGGGEGRGGRSFAEESHQIHPNCVCVMHIRVFVYSCTLPMIRFESVHPSSPFGRSNERNRSRSIRSIPEGIREEYEYDLKKKKEKKRKRKKKD